VSGTPFDLKEQIRQATDIVDLVGSYLPLKRQGRHMVALCPWHDDSRPSLQVDPSRQSWRCWVCNIGGDVFSFVMRREGVEFVEALRMLADRAGIAFAPRGSMRREAHQEKATLYKAAGWAADQFHQWLVQSPAASPFRDYLAERGIDAESIRRFRLGASPPGTWQWLIDRARSTPYSEKVLEAVGLVLARDQRHYDRFRGRLIFPIRDEQQRTVAFGARVLPEFARVDDPKYINSPETLIFSKNRHLYGIDLARDTLQRRRRVVVVEGYTDVIMAHQQGVREVVAVLGTALGPNHVRLLKRYADRVCLLLDGDTAGQKRTMEVLDLFVSAEVDLRVATLPEGYDPADYVAAHGADALGRLVDEATDALDFKLSGLTRGIDLQRQTHEAHRALESVLSTLAQARPSLGGSAWSSRIRQEQMLARLARTFQVDMETLRRRLGELRRRRTDRSAGPGAAAPVGGARRDAWELELVELMTLDPGIAAEVVRRCAPDQCEHPGVSQILSAGRELLADGRPVDFEHLMVRLEDDRLKHLLVEAAEAAARKDAVALADAHQRLDELLARQAARREDAEAKRLLARLHGEGLSEEEVLGELQKQIEKRRLRQGISAPTDG